MTPPTAGQHTPTFLLWEVMQTGDTFTVMKRTGAVLCNCLSETKALEIVRAVNRDHLFGELVEALSSLYRLVSYMKDLKPDTLWQMEAARKALAKAEAL